MGLLGDYLRSREQDKINKKLIQYNIYEKILDSPQDFAPGADKYAAEQLGITKDDSIRQLYQQDQKKKLIPKILSALFQHQQRQNGGGQQPQAQPQGAPPIPPMQPPPNASRAPNATMAPWATPPAQQPTPRMPTPQIPQLGQQRQPQAKGQAPTPQGTQQRTPPSLFISPEQRAENAARMQVVGQVIADKYNTAVRDKNYQAMMGEIQKMPPQLQLELIPQAFSYRYQLGKVPTTPGDIMKPARFKLADGKEIDVHEGSRTGSFYDLEGNPWTPPEGAMRVASQASSAMPRFGTQLVMLSDAKKLMASGAKFDDPEGKPLDLESIPSGMALQPMTVGGKLSYVPIDPRYQKYVVGNTAYAATPQELPSLAVGGGTVLGPQNVGVTTQREVQGLDAKGNPIAQTLTTQRTPQTTGVLGNRAVVAPTPASPASATPSTATPQRNQPGSTVGGGRPIGTPPPVPSARESGVRPLLGMQAGTYNRMLDRITSVREGAAQIFGDPSQPAMRSLSSYASLADDPQAREKLGKALLLTFDEMSHATGGSGITGEAGPISVHAGGGVVDLLEQYFRVPAARAAQANATMQRAINDLTPEQREAYDATMSTFATMVGLRSLTRASASQASVSAIEREIPTIGLFTSDSKQFNDRLQRLAEEVYNGSKGIPRGMWDQNPGLYDYIQGLPGKFANKGAASGGGESSAPPVNLLKEGIETKFTNGQVWTLKGGKPVQVGK